MTDEDSWDSKRMLLPVRNGYAQITEHLFDRDALIVENRQASVVSLCTSDKKPYLTVSFDAPLFGSVVSRRQGSAVYLYRALVR